MSCFCYCCRCIFGTIGERPGEDSFVTLKYVAEWRIGGNSLFKSYVQQTAVRVFRSLQYVRANKISSIGDNIKIKTNNGETKSYKNSTSKLYFYSGLYRIVQVKPPIGKRNFIKNYCIIQLLPNYFVTSYSKEPEEAFEFFLIRHNCVRVLNAISLRDQTPYNRLEHIKECQNDYTNYRNNKGTCKKRGIATELSIVNFNSNKRHKASSDYMLSFIPLKATWASDYGANDLSW